MNISATVLPSIIRTVVPAAVGYVLSFPLTGTVLSILQIDPDTASQRLAQFATVLLIAVYYSLARLGEKYVGPYFGIFLGWLRQPAVYVPDGDNAPITPRGASQLVVSVPLREADTGQAS